MIFSLSEIDRVRFGMVTAKATVDSLDELGDAFAACEKSSVAMLILRTKSENHAVVQAAERRGAILTDTLVYFSKRVMPGFLAAIPSGISIRQATPEDAPRLRHLAAQIFRNYGGHYHTDKRLPTELADEVYASWAENACLYRSTADAVLLAETGKALLGFSVLKKVGDTTFDCCLLGVADAARGQGLFGHLLAASQEWGASQKLATLEYSTQIVNLAAQRGLCRAGFLPFKSYHTFHKWFD